MATASLEWPVPLHQLIRSSEVKVVQSLDVEGLFETLKWIASKLPKEDSTAEKEELQALKDRNAALEQRCKHLEAQHDDLAGQVAQLVRSKESPKDQDPSPELLLLQDRVAQLEADMAAARAASASTPAAEQSSNHVDKHDDNSSHQDDAQQQQQQQDSNSPDVASPVGDQGAAQPAGPRDDLTALQARVSDLEALIMHQNPRGGAPDALGGNAAPSALPASPDIMSTQGSMRMDGDMFAQGTGTASTPDHPQSAQRFQQLQQQVVVSHPLSMDSPSALHDMSKRLSALELRMDMVATSAAATPASGSYDGSVARSPTVLVQQLAHVNTAQDLLPAINNLAEQISRKADASSLQPLIARAADTAAQVADVSRRCAALEARQTTAPGQEQMLESAGGFQSSRPGTPLSADGMAGRVQGMESSMNALNHMLKSLQGTLQDVIGRLGSLGDKVGSLDSGLLSKADKSALDQLALKLAMVSAFNQAASPGSGPDGAAGDAGGEAGSGHGNPAAAAQDSVMSLLQGLVADKATKAELDQLRQLLDQLRAAEVSKRNSNVAPSDSTASNIALSAAPILVGLSTAQSPSGMMSPLGVGSPARAPNDNGNDNAGAAGNPAASDLDSLAQQVRMLQAELGDLRAAISNITNQPYVASSSAAATGLAHHALGVAGAQPSSGQHHLHHGAAGMHGPDIVALRDQLDMVAHAACLMAAGPDASGDGGNATARMRPGAAGDGRSITPTPGPHHQHQQQHHGGNAHHNHSSPAPHAAGHASAAQVPLHAGAVSRLAGLLAKTDVRHKMDWFDPEAINKMAGKLALLEDILNRGGGAAGGGGMSRPGTSAGVDSGVKDLEAQVRKLSKELRAVRDKLSEGSSAPLNMGGWGQGGLRNVDGDHAMLSGKQLQGYRCMACDRPLDSLQSSPGPYVPAHQMPIRLPPSPEAAAKAALMRAPLVGPEASQTKGNLTRRAYEAPQGPNAARGPQTWYEETSKPLAADALPSADVGPRLSPGGWRGGSTPLQGQLHKAGSMLPDIITATQHQQQQHFITSGGKAAATAMRSPRSTSPVPTPPVVVDTAGSIEQQLPIQQQTSLPSI